MTTTTAPIVRTGDGNSLASEIKAKIAHLPLEEQRLALATISLHLKIRDEDPKSSGRVAQIAREFHAEHGRIFARAIKSNKASTSALFRRLETLTAPLGSRRCALIIEAATEATRGLGDDAMPRMAIDLAESILESERALLAAIDAMEPDIRRIAREWHAPPGDPRTALNLELLAMNSIRFSDALAHISARATRETQQMATDRSIDNSWPSVELHGPTIREELLRLEILGEREPAAFRALDASAKFIEQFPDGPVEDSYCEFAEGWLKCAFARLEVGHRLAASFALTDIPDDVEIRAPWASWSLVVPEGLLPPLEDGGTEKPARFWCVGVEPVFMVTGLGRVMAREAMNFSGPIYDAITSLIKGACLALSDPEAFKKTGGRQHAAAKAKRDHHQPVFEQARYLLSAPVKIDLREHLAAVLSGRKGTSPTVQFLVRGHWKHQAHGPRHSLRKTIWIEPFWKGPEESRILLRQHRVEGEPVK